jgi:ABC-type transport system substrate-binding protein
MTPLRRATWLLVGVLAVGVGCGLVAVPAWLLLGRLAPAEPVPAARPPTGPAGGLAEAGATAAAAGPRRGGTLRLPGGQPTTLDPALVRDVDSAAVMYELYSGLVTLAPDLTVVPDLATGWQVSPAGTVYTFTLRSEATFHDGTPVTAADFQHAIERSCDPQTGSAVAETYLGDILGCREKLAGQTDRVSGVAVPDPHTVVLTIDAPKSYFLAKLTYPTSFVLDRRQLASDAGWLDHPNGTGPFRLAEHVPEERLVLERAPGYYGQPAHLDRVEVDLRPVDAATRYENGELDATPVGAGELERVKDPLNPLSREVLVGPGSLGLSYVAFNTRQPPFDDVHVRRAFNLALDKRRLVEVVLHGAVQPADSILPPGLPGHSPDLRPYPFDPAAARAELAASRYGSPASVPPVVLYTSGEGGSDPVAAAVADYLTDALGVPVTVEQAPWERFQEELAEGAYGMYILGWAADYPDPQDFLDVLFHGASPLNSTGYANPEVDALLEAARVEQDEAARLARYAEAERRILADAPWIPLYTGVETWLVAPEVHGFSLPAIVLPRLARVWLAER